MNVPAGLDPLFLTTLAGSLSLLALLVLVLVQDVSFDEEPGDPAADEDLPPVGRPSEGPRRAA